MNKAYWVEARKPCSFVLSQCWKHHCARAVSTVTWERKESEQEYFKCWPFPTSRVLTALAPQPCLCQCPSTEGNIACNGQLVPLEKQFMLTLGTANSEVVSGCLSGSQAPLKNAFLRLSLYPLATCQELSMISRKPGCYIYSLVPLVLEKSERWLCREHSTLVLRIPLQSYLNCLLQLKVSFLLLPCCVAESPLMLHYLVSQEWALWLQMLWNLQANLDYLKKWGISLWF